MAKGSKRDKRAKQARDDRDRKTAKSVRALQRHLDELVDEQRALRKRVKRLGRRLEADPPRPPLAPGPGPGGGRRPWSGPPREGLGPVVSLEVPLETDDPAAPLWATVAARLPEEITCVTDDGRVARYRYSAVGSTPQAPRYRHLVEPPSRPAAGGPAAAG